MTDIDLMPEDNATNEYLAQWLMNRLGLTRPPSLAYIEAFRFAIKTARKRNLKDSIRKPKNEAILSNKAESAKDIVNEFLRSPEFIMLLIFIYGTIDLAHQMSRQAINTTPQNVSQPGGPKI